jgi:NAD(P)-dependent dehydrogenase (short-subunit alcohol dehydrogenase family)
MLTRYLYSFLFCRFCMEVNFFGVVSVTKTFLPLLKRTKGRIINVSSVAGVACGYPLSSAYASSKHAVELFTSSLRQEMKPWGIKVSANAESRSSIAAFWAQIAVRLGGSGEIVMYYLYGPHAVL